MRRLRLSFLLGDAIESTGDTASLNGPICEELGASNAGIQEISAILSSEKESLSKIIQICEVLQTEAHNSSMNTTTNSSLIDQLLKTDENGEIILSDDSDDDSSDDDSDTDTESDCERPGLNQGESSTASSFEVLPDTAPKIILAPKFTLPAKQTRQSDVERHPRGCSVEN